MSATLVVEPSEAKEEPHGRPAGYVEAMTGTAVLGWAWMPGRAERLGVELRLGAQVVAEAVADELREDLTRSGIGDGHHAFTLTVPEVLRPRMAELRVMARTADGRAVPLGSPPVEDGIGERLVQLQRGMEVLAGSQRVLHRNVQAVLVGRGAEAGSSTEATTAAQAELRESIAALELFVVRLEHGLNGVRPAPMETGPRWALVGGAAAALLALITSAWTLVHVMPG